MEKKGKGGGEVILAEKFPRRGPNLKGPVGVEEIVDPTANGPGKESGQRGDAMASRVERKPGISEGKKKPDDESIEESARPTDEAEAEDADDLLLGQARGKTGEMGMGGMGNHEVLRMAKKGRIGKWLERIGGGSNSTGWREFLATEARGANLRSRCETLIQRRR